MKPRIVLKVGSSNISNGEMIDEGKLARIAGLIDKLRARYDVLLVSSGAVASGYTRLKIDKSLLPTFYSLTLILRRLPLSSQPPSLYSSPVSASITAASVSSFTPPFVTVLSMR